MKIAIALLPLLALGLVPATGIAAAPLHPAIAAADAQAVIDANAQLTARIEATSRGTPLPMLSNEGAALVRAAFDVAVIRAAPLDDIDRLAGMCQGIGTTIIAYSQALEKEAAGDAAALQAATVRLQNEIALGTAAGNICTQRSFRAIDKLLGTVSPDVRGKIAPALQMMRSGATMTIRGTLSILEIEGFTPANQDLIMAALAEDSAVIAASFPKAEREQIVEIVRQSAARAGPRLKPALQRLAQSFTTNACNTLCKAVDG